MGRRRFQGEAEIVEGEQGKALWAQYQQLHPSYPQYRISRGVDSVVTSNCVHCFDTKAKQALAEM